MDSKLSMKTEKIMYLKNLYIHIMMTPSKGRRQSQEANNNSHLVARRWHTFLQPKGVTTNVPFPFLWCTVTTLQL